MSGRPSAPSAAGAGQVRDPLQVQREPPQVAWETEVGRLAELGERAIPLRPHRVGVLGEVQAGDLLAALPAPVRRRVSRHRWRASGNMPVPDPGRRDRRCLDGMALAESRRLELGDHARDLLVAARGDHVQRLAMLERRDRLVQPHRHPLGAEHGGEPVGDR